MDQTRPDGGAASDDEAPNGRERGAAEGPSTPPAPPSNFPTFGQTPGWQDEPDPHAPAAQGQQAGGAPWAHEQPTQQYGRQPYGQPQAQPHTQQPYDQQSYDQGYGYPGYTYEQPPVAYPGYGGAAPYGRPYTETETGAVVALILSILSWVACPVLLAIPALIVAGNSRAKIHSFPERYSGLSLVKAARLIAWVNIGVVAGGLALLMVIGTIAAAID